jgi:hypothetical protein
MNNVEKILQKVQSFLCNLSIESELHIKGHNYIQIRVWPINNYVELSISDLRYVREISGCDEVIISSSLNNNQMFIKLRNESRE